MRAALLASIVATAACGGRSTSAPIEQRDAGAPADAAIPLEVPARPLGMPDLAGFGWRKRGGHPAFRDARKAEAADRWTEVAAICQQVLAADPGHLEAAWLLAVALAKLGKHDQVLAPLQLAAAGDFGKWGAASLEQPALQPFLRTPIGEAWRRRVEQDRAAYLAALARSLAITAGGDLYAYDADGARWHRLTRTSGAVVGVLRVPAAQRLVFVLRTRQRNGNRREPRLSVGVVDLTRGRTGPALDVGGPGPITVAYSLAKANPGPWISVGAPRGGWRRLDEEAGKLVELPARSTRPRGAWLELTRRLGRVYALPVPDVTADWDEHGLASAIRIARSNRVVAVASPGLIDGNTVAWSADRAHLAFVAQLADECTPGALNVAAFVADAATGTLRELARGERGLAVEWLRERRLAIAGDDGVSIVDLDGGPPLPLAGAEHLAVHRHRPHCLPAEPDDDAPDDAELADTAGAPPLGAAGAGPDRAAPVDAGAADAR